MSEDLIGQSIDRRDGFLKKAEKVILIGGVAIPAASVGLLLMAGLLNPAFAVGGTSVAVVSGAAVWLSRKYRQNGQRAYGEYKKANLVRPSKHLQEHTPGNWFEYKY